MIKRWVNRERHRYYIAVVTGDLFGGWNLQRFWGGVDSRRGGQLSHHFDEAAVIDERLRQADERRKKRGYV